jgi:leucyl/phenylalanyl-tRNA--protein transferase
MPVFQLNREITFPSPELAEPDGLIAVGGDLSPERLVAAYRLGIFPWYGEGDPILWWTPSPRLVLFPKEFHISRRLARTIRQNIFCVTADCAFKRVVTSCAAKRSKNRPETWITNDMIKAYCYLHELGYAHSIECWHDDRLVGGMYGVALDHVFFGESMFSDMNNGSKIALHALVQHAMKEGIGLIDCQMRTDHLVSLGAREISRSSFEKHLRANITELHPQKKWRLH